MSVTPFDADLPVELSVHLTVENQRPKALIRGRGGSGLVATDRGIHYFEERRDQHGFPWVHMEFMRYSDIAEIEQVPARGWFGRPRIMVGSLGLVLDTDSPGAPPHALDDMRRLLDMRDYELRREYQPGRDADFTFLCPLCGTHASARRSAEVRLRLADEHLGWDAMLWDQTQCRDDAWIPETLERLLGVPYREAVRLLEEAERIGLLARHRKGTYARAVSLCENCYEARVNPPSPAVPEPKPRRRDPIPPRLRFIVMQRDGFRCAYCGKSAGDGVVLHVDHVEPVVVGGETNEDNLITACDECNLGKSDRDVFG